MRTKLFVQLLYQIDHDVVKKKRESWGARIRTWGCRDQNPVPYHLATPQRCLWMGILLKFIAVSNTSEWV